MKPPEPDLPRAVALAWGVAANPQRGPKREMSIERIVDVAVELADAGGLGAVSMAAVASALGFTPMSLYRYVTAKDDLVAAHAGARDRRAARVDPTRPRAGAPGSTPGRARPSTSTSSTRGCSTSRSRARRRPRTTWPGSTPRCRSSRPVPLD